MADNITLIPDPPAAKPVLVPDKPRAQQPQDDANAVPPESKTPAGRLLQGFTDYDARSNLADKEAKQEYTQGLDDLFKETGVLRKGMGALEAIGGSFDYATVPIKAAAQSFIGDPVQRFAAKHLDKSGGISRYIGDFVNIGAQIFTGAPEEKGIAKAIGDIGETKVATGVKEIISPTALKPSEKVTLFQKGAKPFTAPLAKVAEYTVRANAGAMAQARAEAAHSLENYQRAMAHLPEGTVSVAEDGVLKAAPNSKIDFIDAIETGDMARLPPEMRKAAGQLRTMLDTWRDKVRSLGRGYLENAIDNYFPHIWKDPAKAAVIKDALEAEYGRLASKRTLKGAATFLKQRTIGSTVIGLAHGLVPVTTNPLELTLLKVREMQKFYFGTKILDEMKESGLVKFARSAVEAPPDWRALEGNEFRIFAPAAQAEAEAGLKTANMAETEQGATGIGPQAAGRYYASPQVYTILRNYMSAGLRGNGVYDSIRHFGNGLNQLQLAWPGFHAMFVTNDTMVSEMGRAVERAFHGEFGRALKSAIAAPVSVVPTVLKGGRLRSAYLAPAGAPPEMVKLVNALREGGGRVNMDDFYRASESGSFIRSFKNGTFVRDIFGDFKEHPFSAFPRLVGKTLDLLAAPIMDAMVPRAKLGVFSNLAEDFLRRNPGASQMEVREAMTRVWDSVDNRLGQMAYDNLFWNKTVKDIGFLAVRSVGWNLGTIRELGGALPDTAKFAHAMMSGDTPALTHRMAYAFALPVMLGTEGATITYLTTGHGPTQFLDYFFPPTGGSTPTGAPERVSLPGYMKDVVEYNTQPGQTIFNKAQPMFEIGHEVFNNRDFYGALIADPQDPGSRQLVDWVKYFGGQALPFSVRGYERLAKEPTSKIPSAAGFLGIQPAPGYITDPARGAAFQARADRTARRKKLKEESQ